MQTLAVRKRVLDSVDHIFFNLSRPPIACLIQDEADVVVSECQNLGNVSRNKFDSIIMIGSWMSVADSKI